MLNKGNKILSGIMGLCVGDALGVPVEFTSREHLKQDPVVDMRSGGTYNLPKGTWSDDSSMTLATLDSLKNGLDYKDIMDKFVRWFHGGEYSPYGSCFDIGIGTRNALSRYQHGTQPLLCGGKEENECGNGSLMRILPVAFFLSKTYRNEITDHEEAMEIIHNVSSLTHRHPRCHVACGIYISIACEIIAGTESLEKAITDGMNKAKKFYMKKVEYKNELEYYNRIFEKDFAKLPVDKIKSTGYVLDTLEAVLWCLLNTSDYKECVLKCVNLASDTDTVAAIAGGIAGLYYGYVDIPKEWLGVIAKREWIESLCK